MASVFDDKVWDSLDKYVKEKGTDEQKRAYFDWEYMTDAAGVDYAKNNYVFDDATWSALSGIADQYGSDEERAAFYDLTSKTGWNLGNNRYKYDPVKLLQDSLSNHKGFEYNPTNPEYKTQANELIQQFMNRKYHYDPSADPAAEALRREYINGGRLAMRDTLGTASAATGGLASSFAQQAGQQAYGAYMKDYATNVIPSLEQMARQKYEQETNDILTRLGVLNDAMKADRDYQYQQYVANQTAAQNELATKLQIAEYEQNKVDAANQAKYENDVATDKEIRSSFASFADNYKNAYDDAEKEAAFAQIQNLELAYKLEPEELKDLFVLAGISYAEYEDYIKRQSTQAGSSTWWRWKK